MIKYILNHEVWRKCSQCGGESDLRITNICNWCGNIINNKSKK